MPTRTRHGEKTELFCQEEFHESGHYLHLHHRVVGGMGTCNSRAPGRGPRAAVVGAACGRRAGTAVRSDRPARGAAGGHHGPVGAFHPAPGHPGRAPAGELRAGFELPQSVQSFHDDSVSTSGLDARAAGGVQPSGSAHCHAGGRGAAGRFSHGGVGRHRCGGSGGGGRGCICTA